MLLAFARRWALLFVALFAATVPLNYRVLPSPGVALRPWLEASGRALTGQPVALFSDSAGLYAWAGLLLLGTALVAGAWLALGQRTAAGEVRLWYVLHTGAAGWLAWQLLIYGFDKVFKHQFYLPEPNTLYTPLGLLTPDLAYWSVVGASRSYSVFAGLLEVLPGLLLLWGRTRLLGGLLALAVLANVLALNIGFDISVKLWSGFLLGLAGLVAAPGLGTLYAGLVREQWQAPARPPRPGGWQGRGVGALRGLLLGVLLLETAGPFITEGNLNDDLAPRPFLHGAYAISSLRPGAAPLRVFVHRQGYFIIQTADGQLQDYPLRYGPGCLLLGGPHGRPDTLRYTRSAAGLRLAGTLGADSVRWLARPLAWRKLPLLQKGHWAL